MRDQYFDRPEVSNSDLGWLEEYFLPVEQVGDREAAYRFGTLVDAVITEGEKVDYYRNTVDGEPYTADEFQRAVAMKKSLRQNELWRSLCRHDISFQRVFDGPVTLKSGRVEFALSMRCKYDFYMNNLMWGGDIKSTFATTQKQFEEACRYFDYDRQRATYMKLSGARQDIIFGISKVNYRVFTLAIKQGDDFYNSGIKKLTDIGFWWWCLFDGFAVNQLQKSI